jgi:hypothetical protein
MCTVLRVTGPYEELRSAIQTIPLEFSEAGASTKARGRNDASYDGRSTYNLTVSDADGDCVPQQMVECESFFTEHANEMAMIRKLACVEEMCLDFMWAFPETIIAQFHRLPASLLKRCGELGVDIEMSVYSCADVKEST